MKISYYLNEGRKKNLYCRISDGSERVTFSLEYSVEPKQWDIRKQELNHENEYYYTLKDFKEYLEKKYHELKGAGITGILTILKNEAASLMGKDGIEGIAKNMFDLNNSVNGIPKYGDFIQAFEKFSKLKKGQYKVQAVGNCIHFHTDKVTYEIDTYEGRTALLKSFFDRRSHEEICTMTDVNIWREIYVDGDIEKHIFLPCMLKEWENYWEDLYIKIKGEIGRTEHLDKLKQQSWRQFQVFMECYDSHNDSIKLAYEIDEMLLFPLSVFTMLQIFNEEACYSEYCEMEFYDSEEEWESITLNDENNSPVFFIKPWDFYL